MGSGIPIKSKTTENAKDSNSALVLRGGSCSNKSLISLFNETANTKNATGDIKSMEIYF